MADASPGLASSGALKMFSATSVGRELEQGQALLMPVMRWALGGQPLSVKLTRRRVLTAAAVVLALRRLRQWMQDPTQLEKRAKEYANAIMLAAPGAKRFKGDIEGNGSDSAADAKKPSDEATEVKVPRASIMNLFRGEDGRVNIGLPELASVLVASLLSTVTMLYKGRLLGKLMMFQNQGDMTEWISTAIRYPVTCVTAAALQTSFNYFQARFTLKLRRIITQKLHSLYFSNMLYYQVMNSQKGLRIEDPDLRICNDVQASCESYANIAVMLSNAVLMSLLFSWAMRKPLDLGKNIEVGSSRDWKWGLLAPVFSLVVMPTLLLFLGQSQLGWVHGCLQAAKSKYEQVLTRVQLHGERICMLQGEPYELAYLNESAQAEGYWEGYSYTAQGRQEYIQSMCFNELSLSIIVHMGFYSGAVMMVNRLRKPGGRAALGILDEAAPAPEAAEDFALAIQDNWTVMYSIAAAGMFGASLVGLGYTRVSGDRITELYSNLVHMQSLAQQSASGSAGTIQDCGPTVSFEDVTVQTPTMQVLLQHLTFKVSAGETLLISGHNGAGKSSIIRCLCRLWQISHGSIARPGGAVHAEEDASLHEQIYYLPQKPVSVLGSLSDQLTYPMRVRGGLPDEELRRWLRYVNLEYLADRSFADEAPPDDPGEAGGPSLQNWEEALSLGEQQALSIARLLYHHPRFAILDECTSAISKGLERRLFEVARELGMACITITHRPALQEHHMRALRLTGAMDQDGRGWEIEELPNSSRLSAGIQRPCEGADEAHERILAYLRGKAEAAHDDNWNALEQERAQLKAVQPRDAQSKPGAVSLEATVRKRWPYSWQRLVAMLRLGLTEGDQSWKFCRRMVILVVLLRLRCSMFWDLWRSLTAGMRCGLTGNVAGLQACILTSLVGQPVATYLDWQIKDLIRRTCLELSVSVRCALHNRALGGGAFLRVLHTSDPRVPVVENPVQRIAEVRALFNDIQSQFEPMLLVTSATLYTLPMLIRGGGPRSLLILGASFVIFGCCQAAAPDWKKITQEIRKLESRFQVLHTRLRHVAEPVAFSGGGGAERKIIEPRFDHVCDFRRKALNAEFVYNWVMTLFSSYDLLPMGVQRLLSVGFATRNCPDVSLGISPRVITANLLYDRTIQLVQQAEMKFVQFLPEWQRMDGKFFRLLELVVAFDMADATLGSELPPTAGKPEAGAYSVQGGEGISVRKLDLITPRGACLAIDMDFELKKGAPLLVTGPNASGKSLLGCMLVGLLPPSGAEASVRLPGPEPPSLRRRAPLGLLMAAPQRIYLPLGTLGDQVTYPSNYEPSETPGGVTEDDMLGALRATGIDYLHAREAKGWLAQRVWEDALSGGEQQRMVLARIFFRKPCFALLDECTSMVASNAEQGLYHALVRDFGITPCTISQRLFLSDLHPTELRLGVPTVQGWALASTAADAQA